MDNQKIVYVSYIASTLEKVGDALTNPDITEQYWKTQVESSCLAGEKILYRRNRGDYLRAYRPPCRMLSHTFHPVIGGFSAESPSRVTFELAQKSRVVRLTFTHEDFEPNSNVYRAGSNGWPMILSSLKTLLETGQPLPTFRFSPEE